MKYKNQIGENPDWEIKQQIWKRLRKQSIRQTYLLGPIFCLPLVILGIYVYVIHPDIFSCDRDKGICTLQTRNFYESSYKEKYTFKISEFRGARLRRHDYYRINYHSIALRVNNTDIPLFDYGGYPYTLSQSSLESQIRQINNFLKYDKKQLEIKEDIHNLRDGSIWIALGLILLILFSLPMKTKKT